MAQVLKGAKVRTLNISQLLIAEKAAKSGYPIAIT